MDSSLVDPLVSVIVVTYNHEDFISECLDGILNQETNFSFEIILGEDESSDRTREICQQYSQTFPNKIRLFLRSRKEVIHVDGHPTGIFNFKECLKSAKGKYIAICEGDDYWIHPLKLQKQVDFLENNSGYNISFHNAIVRYPSSKDADQLFTNTDEEKIYTIQNLISDEPLIPTASILFRRSKLGILPEWYNRIMNSDMALFILVCGDGKIHFMNESWSVYRKHSGGISNVISGDIKYLTRLKMFYYLLKHYQGAYHERFRQVIRYCFGNLSDLRRLSLKEHWNLFSIAPLFYLKKISGIQ